MDGTHRITERLNWIVKTVTQLIAPSPQRRDLPHPAETRRPAYSHQVFDRSLRSVLQRLRRVLFPKITIDRAAHRVDERLKDLEALSNGIRLSIVLLIVSLFGYMRLALPMLPSDPYVQFSAGFLPPVLLAIGLRLQRSGLTMGPTGKPKVVLQSIDPDGQRRRFVGIQSEILLGDFSPSKAPLRSAAIALAGLLIIFAPAYPVLQWLNGYPLPAGVSWAGIAFRFFLALLLFGWFGWIWKASKLAAAACKAEITDLDSVA